MLALFLTSLVVNAGEPDALARAGARRAEIAEALSAARALQADAEGARDAERARCVARKLPALEALDRLAEGALFVVSVDAGPRIVAEESHKLELARDRAADLRAAAQACANALVEPPDGIAEAPLDAVEGDPPPVLIEIPPAECGTCR